MRGTGGRLIKRLKAWNRKTDDKDSQGFKNLKFEQKGINMENIQSKTEYCLNCANKPCTTGCPLGNNIPEFIALAKQNFE